MLIYMGMTAIIALYVGIHKNINANDVRRKKFLIFAFGLMIIISCLRGYTVGRDLAGHYARNYVAIASRGWNEIPLLSVSTGYDIGFVYFCKLLSVFSDNVQWFIVAVSILLYTYLGHFIYKYSTDVVGSTFIVIFSCIYYMYMTMIRQALAVTLVMIGYEVLTSNWKRFRKYLVFSALVVAASTFHQSALICLVFILFDILRFERRHILIAIIVTMVMYVTYDKIYGIALSLVGSSERYAAHILSQTEGVGGLDWIGAINIILTFGAFLIGVYSLVWRHRKIHEDAKDKQMLQKNSLILYLCLMAGIFRLLASQMNIMNRVTYYFIPFILVLYPVAIHNSGKYRQVFKVSVYGLYFLYFLYVSANLANAYYGTVPYTFFWQ